MQNRSVILVDTVAQNAKERISGISSSPRNEPEVHATIDYMQVSYYSNLETSLIQRPSAQQ